MLVVYQAGQYFPVLADLVCVAVLPASYQCQVDLRHPHWIIPVLEVMGRGADVVYVADTCVYVVGRAQFWGRKCRLGWKRSMLMLLPKPRPVSQLIAVIALCWR